MVKSIKINLLTFSPILKKPTNDKNLSKTLNH